MKILVISPYFYPHKGGSERYIEGLYGAVRKLDPRVNVDVLTYDTGGRGGYEEYRGMRIYRVGCVEILKDQFALPNYVELVGLLRELKKNGYDVVNSHTRFFDNSWWGWLAAKYLSAKSVLTDHCAYHPSHGSGVVRGVARVVDWVGIRLLGHVYGRVTVVSEATRKFLVSGGMEAEVKVFSCAVDVGGFGANKNKMKLRGVKNDDVVVVFVGRLLESKGVMKFVEVAKRFEGKKGVKFVVAGGGVLLGEVKKSDGDNLKVLGKLSEDEVAELLKRANIFVLPSSHHEGLPISLLEAGASGCAVVATNRGGVGEVIRDGETGLIVGEDVDSVEQAVRRLVEDEKLRLRLIKGLSRRVAVGFNIRKVAKRYVDWLKAVASMV